MRAGSDWGRRAAGGAAAILLAAVVMVTPATAGSSAPASSPVTQPVTPPVTESVPPSDTPEEKIEPSLQRTLDAEQTAPLWVRFTDQADLAAASAIDDWAERGTAVAAALKATAETSQAEVRAQLDAAGVTYEAFWATNAIRIEDGTAELAAQLSARPEVDSLHATQSYELPETEPVDAPSTLAAGEVEWGVANVRADDVWEQYGVTGEGITVATIDSGALLDHPALVDHYRGANADGTFDHDHNWFDASGLCAGAPCDDHGHGSHVTGIIVGADGDADRIGVAPGATWIAANGCCTDAGLIASGQWMLEPTDLNGQNPDPSRRPHVINNSWGSLVPSNDPFMEDISLAWEAAGIFATWANGNEGPRCQTSGSPGSRIVNYSVGAYDVDDVVYSDSSRGAGQDGEIKPNIAAPGVAVRSAWKDGGYELLSGTSMAAPHVSGAVALMWSAAPALVGDVEATRDLLDGSAVDTPNDECGGAAGDHGDDNNVFGEGRLDALALLDSAPVGDTGTLVTTVTDAASGDPIPGARIAIDGPVDRERVTGDDGTYTVPLRVGDYQVTATAFGYVGGTAEVSVAQDETAELVVALERQETVTLSGRVVDGSGQGWPLYARVTVDGMPGGTVYTDPEDGAYSIEVPVGATYELSIEPEYDGYQAGAATVTVGDDDLAEDVELERVTDRCTTPGYGYSYTGAGTDFDHGLPEGWTVTDDNGSGHTWSFDDPYDLSNLTGGTEGWASAQSPGGALYIDTTLTTPVLDLSDDDAPVIGFRQALMQLGDVADVDLSVDGGRTWETVLNQTRVNTKGAADVSIPVPQAAGQSEVVVRFHYHNARYSSYFWQLDDVYVGSRSCDPVEGGLVIGNVTDANTGEPVNGARLAARAAPLDGVESIATPDDPGLDDGFYALFMSGDGDQELGFEGDRYAAGTATLTVGDGDVTGHDIELAAGRLEVDGDPSATLELGEFAEQTVTLSNTGTAPLTVDLTERRGSSEILRPDGTTATQEEIAASAGAPVRRVEGEASPLGFDPASDTVAADDVADQPADGPWTDLTDYPIPVQDNAVGEVGGRIYSVGGIGGVGQLDWVSAGWVYDPATQVWEPIADLPEAREAAVGAGIGDLFYVTGGNANDQRTRNTTWAYDPHTDRWTELTPSPRGFYGAGAAVLDGQLYVVGGCDPQNCGRSDAFRYDPATDTWTTLADYPINTSRQACAGIDGRVVCAGGMTRAGTITNHTYAYDPATDTWTRVADLPTARWGSAYTGASGELIVAGGYDGSAITNESFAYDPVADVWLDMPATSNVLYRSGSACGLNRVGGSNRTGFNPVTTVDQLPTYGDCQPADVSWLSVSSPSVELDPGEQVEVTVRVEATVGQPGTYRGGVWVREDTPYAVAPVEVTMDVEVPRRWGALAGTVTTVTCDGADAGALPGATVLVDGRSLEVELTADRNGYVQRWVDRAEMPLTVTVSADGYETWSQRVRPPGDGPSVVDVALRPDTC
ncbi:S8 family serine peptidase [Jiangella asiatica]|nr:S8 family serine peptidase [Jiangella asiatica]